MTAGVQRMTLASDDPAVSALGATGDAAATQGSTGSISAKLRTVTSQLNTIATTGIPITGTVTVGSHAVTNAGTFAVQVDGSALTALQLLDDPVFADDAAFTLTSSKVVMSGAIRDDALATLTAIEGDAVPLRVDANGAQWVVVNGAVTVGSHAVTNAGTFAVQVDGTALTRLTDIETNTDSGAVIGNGAAATAQRVTLANDSTGIVALTTSTASIGKLAANSGVDIGDVDVTSVPTDPFGANADAASATGSISAKLRFIASTGIPITGTVTVGSHAVTNAGTFAVQAAQSGTWTVELGATDNAVLDAIAASLAGTLTIAGPVTNSGTFVVQENGAALTALQLIDDTVATLGTTTYTEATTKGLIIGAVRRDADTTLANTTNEVAPLQVDANGYLKVEIFDGGGSHTVDNAGTFAVQIDGAALTSLQLIDDAISGTEMQVDIVASLPAGTNNIGDVDIVSGTITTVTTLTGGGVAHDAADSGNPHKIGAKAIASLATTTLVSGADRTDAQSDLDGAIITRPQFPLGDLLSDATSNTDGASTASGVFTATASTKSYITAFQIFRTDAGTSTIYIDFRDGTAGAVLWRAVVPPNGGSNSPSSTVPLFKTSANTALAYDVSAATSTVYINVSGFKSKL